jgi:ABC-type multidrug transport system ATPase subunit
MHFDVLRLFFPVGPSGCGKTTLCDIMTGRCRYGYASGSVWYGSINMLAASDSVKDRVALSYLAHHGQIYCPTLTTYENLYWISFLHLHHVTHEVSSSFACIFLFFRLSVSHSLLLVCPLSFCLS